MTDDDNQLIQQRRAKLDQMREKGNAFPNTFRPTHIAADLHKDHDGREKDDVAADNISVSVGGRMMFRRIMGKANCFFIRAHWVKKSTTRSRIWMSATFLVSAVFCSSLKPVNCPLKYKRSNY